MDSTHVIALIASNLMVRNQLAIGAAKNSAERASLVEALADPIEEARQIIEQVMSDEPVMPDAPNTKGGRQSAAVNG